MARIKSFKKLTAPGLSGLRVSHICEALDTAIRIYRVDLMDALCSLISASSKGLLPAWSAPFFCAARLVPFAKKAGGGGYSPWPWAKFCVDLLLKFSLVSTRRAPPITAMARLDALTQQGSA